MGIGDYDLFSGGVCAFACVNKLLIHVFCAAVSRLVRWFLVLPLAHRQRPAASRHRSAQQSETQGGFRHRRSKGERTILNTPP